MQSIPRTRWVAIIAMSLPIGAWSAETASDATAQIRHAYMFDYRMLHGKLSETTDAKVLFQPVAKSGTYGLELRVNDRLIGVRQVRLNYAADVFKACLEADVITKLGISENALSELAKDIINGNGSCATIERITEGGKVTVDFPNLRLDVTIPQASLAIADTNWPMPEQWESGGTAGRVVYNSNFYSMSSPAGNSAGGFLALDMGLDLGNYHLRQRTNLSTQRAAGKNTFSAKGDSSYLFTDIASIGAVATLGQTYSRTHLFEPIVLRGLNIQTDDRMLAPEWRSPRPAIEGISRTGAHIEIRQFGSVQYETSVPPGPYRLTDLPISGNGFDLEVTATETDGTANRFTVPTVTSNYLLPEGSDFGNLSVGNMLSSARQEHGIAQFEWQSGVSHGLTLNMGLTGMQKYAAGLLGLGATTPVGAFTLNVTGSRSGADAVTERSRGGSVSGTYTKGFARTNTNFVIGTIRLSSMGYESTLDNVDRKDRQAAVASAYWQTKYRSRITLNVSQKLGDFGTLIMAAARSVAWNGGLASSSLSASHSLSMRSGMTLYTSISRTKNVDNLAQWAGSLGVSFPFGRTDPSGGGSNLSVLSSVNSSAPGQYSLGYNKTLGLSNGRSLAYGASASAQAGSFGDLSTFVNYSSPLYAGGLSFNGNGSRQQLMGSMNGAAVIHAGGINYTRNLGDTLVLVHAPGAEGARIGGMDEQTVADNGYALLSYVNPYARNTIDMGSAQDSLGYRADDPIRTLVPRAGTVNLVKFSGSLQDVFLLTLDIKGHGQATFGTEIHSAEGSLLGYVGQKNRAEVRAPSTVRYITLRVAEGNQKHQVRCDLNEARRTHIRVADMKQAKISCENIREGQPDSSRPLAQLK